MEAATALALALGDCVLADRSSFARLQATGRDILDLLHRLSTQDVKGIPAGFGAPTVLTSAKGRIVERLLVHRLAEREVLLVAGPGRAKAVLAHLQRYTFAEETGLSDVTAATAHYALIGPDAPRRLAAAGLPDPGPYGAVRAGFADVEVVLLGEDGLSPEGRSVVVTTEAAPAVREALERFAPSVDAATLEIWRILRGLPGPGTELSEDWNPLEAGLRDHVSFTKGCYVGQEVVARLNTYDKVSRRLVVLTLPGGAGLPETGAALLAGDRPVGQVTSAARLPDGGVAVLGYVKSRNVAGDVLRVGADEGTILNP